MAFHLPPISARSANKNASFVNEVVDEEPDRVENSWGNRLPSK